MNDGVGDVFELGDHLFEVFVGGEQVRFSGFAFREVSKDGGQRAMGFEWKWRDRNLNWQSDIGLQLQFEFLAESSGTGSVQEFGYSHLFGGRKQRLPGGTN